MKIYYLTIWQLGLVMSDLWIVAPKSLHRLTKHTKTKLWKRTIYSMYGGEITEYQL